MSSLAELPDLVGFFSYSREDDEDSGGKLSKLRERIQAELRSQLGRTRKDFRLWQDKVAIAHGELWEETIKKGVSESVFFIPIITPTAVRSSYCKFEFDSFLAREKELDRSNLIFPILYVPVPALKNERWRQDPLLSTVGIRQYEDWQNLRHLDASSSEVVALRVQTFCANICKALEQPWLSPEERRQQAEARQVADDERRRQEAEVKQRADDEERRRKAEAEERRRVAEEERRRKEAMTRFDNTTLRLAEAEAESRQRDEERQREQEPTATEKAQFGTHSDQEPQRHIKPWLLPLIGAVAASLPTLLNTLLTLFSVALSAGSYQWVPGFLLFSLSAAMIYALYGATVGMLIGRFGIWKAMAIPVVPLLCVIFVSGFIVGRQTLYNALGSVVLAAISVRLAFWLHSRWARKPRLRDAGVVS